MKKWLFIAFLIFPFLSATAGEKIAISIDNYTLSNLNFSVSDVECMYDTDNFNNQSISPFNSYSNSVHESKKAGKCYLASTKHKFTLDAQSTNDDIGNVKYYRKAGNGNYCGAFSSESYLANNYHLMIAPGCNNSSPTVNVIISYVVSANVNNYLIEPVILIGETPSDITEYAPSYLPPVIPVGSGNVPGTKNLSFSPNNLNDAQKAAIIEYGPNGANYCKFTYGYEGGKCYASGEPINNGNDDVACDATATTDNDNSCQVELNVKPGLIPLKFSEPQTINVNVKNEVYTDLNLSTFSPTDTSSYVEGQLPPNTITDGSSLTPAFQFNQAAATNKQPTVAYTIQQPEGPTCSFNYGWDDVKKVCYANGSGSQNNTVCSGSAEPRTNSTDCTVDLNVAYSNPPTIAVNVKNDATDSSDSLNLKDYQPTSSSDYTGNPPPSSVAPNGNGTFIYNVQNDSAVQPYVEYNYPKASDAYCQFSYNAFGTAGCTASANAFNNDPLYQVTCNQTHNVSNGICTVNFSMDVGPVKPPAQFNVTINNGIYDDLINAGGDDNAPNSIENGEGSATYQESTNGGSLLQKTVTYQMKNFPSSTCTFTYGWNNTQSCYANGVPSSGPPNVDCGQVTATRNGDSCDVNLTFGMPNSNKAGDSTSQSLILRYAKPAVYGSGTVPSACPQTTQNIIFIKSTPEEAIMCVPSQQIAISADPINEITDTLQANWQVYNGPPTRLYNSSAENLNTSIITPPYDANDNLVTYTYQLMTSGTDTFQYQMTNVKALTANYDGNAYMLQGCQEDTTDPGNGHVVCIFQYTPSLQ